MRIENRYTNNRNAKPKRKEEKRKEKSPTPKFSNFMQKPPRELEDIWDGPSESAFPASSPLMPCCLSIDNLSSKDLGEFLEGGAITATVE